MAALPKPREAKPTEAHYASAFELLRRRPRCPRTQEAALAHPVYGVCLRALAKRMACTSARAGTPARVPPAPPRRPPQRTTLQHGMFDARRAAANDRDTDDE